MHRNLRWKIPLILLVVLGSAFLAWPLKEKINLGLDLQGGMHLVLEVQAEEAVEAGLDRRADDIKRALEEDAIEIDRLKVDQETGRLKILLVDESDMAGTEDRLRAYPSLAKVQISADNLEAIYELKNEEREFIKQKAVQQALEIIRNRVDEFGVAEPSIQIQGERRILVQLPGIKDTEGAIKLIGDTARLEFRLVNELVSPDAAKSGGLPPDSEVLFERNIDPKTGEAIKGDGEAIVVKKRAELTGEMLTNADVRFDSSNNMPYVSLTFDSIGSQLFYDITSKNVKKRLAIVLDRHVYSAPVIQEAIAGGQAQVTGSFSTAEARNLAIALRAGALPAEVKVLENRTVGASLGSDSVKAGIESVLAGFVAVLIFIVIYYRLSGMVAVLALFLNIVLLLGALAYFGASLTLPGIAGILLTVGMAIDANVLVFERIREEIKVGKTVRAAIEAGFEKAFRTIVDANVTTFIAAIVLFQFGTGPIKGFAITLCIGILASMFTAVFVSHVVFDSVQARRKLEKLSI
jgi:preprotein translocase subunit SecD